MTHSDNHSSENDASRRWFRSAQRQQSAHRFDAWLNGPEGRLVRDLRHRLLLGLLRPKWGESILHVGCAGGETMRMLADAGTHVAGIDPSPVDLRETRHRLGPFWLTQGEPTALPFADESFDLAILDGCLEFIEDPATAVRELARVARKRIYVGTINPWSLRAAAIRAGARWQPPFYADAQFHSLPRMLRFLTVAETVRWRWGGTPHVPGWLSDSDLVQRLAEVTVTWPNPFAAYLGFVADVLRLAPARIRSEPAVRVVSSAEAAIARITVRRTGSGSGTLRNSMISVAAASSVRDEAPSPVANGCAAGDPASGDRDLQQAERLFQTATRHPADAA